MSDIQIFETEGELAAALADSIEHWVSNAIRDRDVAHIVLAGGSTPARLHVELAQRALPWGAVHIYFGDERCVPPNHADSNFRAVHETLLSKIEIPSGNVHPIDGAAEGRGAVAYRAEIPKRFDIVMLGLGEDGHTASLFPNSTSLHAAESVLYVDDSPKPPAERITLGLSALSSARHIAFIVTGGAKADALKRVRSGESLPAAQVQPTDGTLTFFVDRAAARQEDA